jgi:hypothetical protein
MLQIGRSRAQLWKREVEGSESMLCCREYMIIFEFPHQQSESKADTV